MHTYATPGAYASLSNTYVRTYVALFDGSSFYFSAWKAGEFGCANEVSIICREKVM